MKRLPFVLILLSMLFAGCGSAAPSTPETPIATLSPTETLSPTPEILLTSTPIPSPVPGMLYVDPSTSLGPISPLVYGSNYGPWLVVSAGMLDAAFDSGVTILRFPGGSWGDNNNVTRLQIDQVMDFAAKLGAQVMISVRYVDGTPEQAAELVRYTNLEKKYNVLYWSIGNEPTLYDGVYKNKNEEFDVNRFNREWRAIAEAMKAVDPSIKLIGPEVNQFSYDLTPGATTNFEQKHESYLVEFLKANSDLVDVVSIHRYPFPASRVSGAPSMDEIRLNTREWDKIIIRLRELVHEHTGRDMPVAVTEFNSAYDKSVGQETTPDSHYNAIWLADVLGSLIKNGVFMANQWYLTAKAGYGGLGLLGQFEVFPSYYTYQMYKMFGDELIYSSTDDEDLTIYTARRADGALTVMVINLSLEEKVKALRIGDGARVQGEAWLFDPAHKVEDMGPVDLSSDAAFPPQSVSLFVIP